MRVILFIVYTHPSREKKIKVTFIGLFNIARTSLTAERQSE